MENTAKKDLARTKKIKLQKQEFDINFPNSGQQIDIELKRVALSDGLFDSLLFVRTVSAQLAVRNIKAAAFFSVMIPTLTTQMRVSSLMELQQQDMKEVGDAYMKEIEPWLNEWEEYLFGEVKEASQPLNEEK